MKRVVNSKQFNFSKKIYTALAVVLISTASFSQGTNGIDAGANELKKYVSSVSKLILVIGAIVGLIGGVRVFIKWNNGDHDVNKAVMGWFGSCIFLVLVGGIINSFFGIS